ncbi:hypothetical protein BaRGS_00018262 [Batillaria attramentaria]|uniref:Uncharacterized protein n=1 Tax=Batillaria attramentaria TaxID=370345 RepID=A0ABD0KTW9_9CAEN
MPSNTNVLPAARGFPDKGPSFLRERALHSRILHYAHIGSATLSPTEPLRASFCYYGETGNLWLFSSIAPRGVISYYRDGEMRWGKSRTAHIKAADVPPSEKSRFSYTGPARVTGTGFPWKWRPGCKCYRPNNAPFDPVSQGQSGLTAFGATRCTPSLTASLPA